MITNYDGILKKIDLIEPVKYARTRNFIDGSVSRLSPYISRGVISTKPDEFLKSWLLKTSEQPITIEVLDKEYDMYAKSLQWQLIENKVMEIFNVKVTQDDVLAHAKKLISIQMKQYGQPEGDDKQLTDIANNILKNEEERKKIYDQIFDERTLKVYKENFKLTEKSISYDQFVKLASEK